MSWRAWGGWIAGGAWLLLRLQGSQSRAVLSLPAGSGSLVYLYWDWTWLLVAVAVAIFTLRPPSERAAWLGVCVVGAATFLQYACAALTRYYAGGARAWDLATYVQPLWRAAHGLSMSSAVHGGAAVWADHGAFVMFAFAPLTRLGGDAATALLAVQALLVAASVVAAYGFGRAQGLPVQASLAIVAVVASSRALLHAATFDFHPECAFPVLFLGAAWAQDAGKTGRAVVMTVIAATLREMAALTVGMLWAYWALRSRRWSYAAIASACWGLAAFDMLALPRLTGWYSYIALNSSAAVDYDVAILTTLLRALSTGLIGWFHPIAWWTGMPWILAAGLSPKLAVKGIDFQYGFLFVPVATLGAAYVLRLVAQWRCTALGYVSVAWLVIAVATNAPSASPLVAVAKARRSFQQLHGRLTASLPRDAAVSADACAAPYVLERPQLTLLCRIDMAALSKHGIERWDEPVPDAFAASYMLVRRDCPVSRPCAASQVDRAQRLFGFKAIERVGPFVILRRTTRVQP